MSADLFYVLTSFQDLCDPAGCSLQEAVRIAKQKSLERRDFDVEVSLFLEELWSRPHIDPKLIERTLVLLAETESPARLFNVLRSAMGHCDPHVRSKSAGALAGNVESAAWLGKLTSDNDARVRANTIEALWGRKSPDIELIFLKAVRDPHHRVAANAAYGLYLIDPIKHRTALDTLIEHPQGSFRCAAAWMLGKIGDGAFIPALKPLMFDKVPEVKRTAFRALASLRTATRAAAA